MLSTGPSIRKVGERLVCRTGWGGRLLSLGACSTTLVVDPAERRLHLTRRSFWFRRRRRAVGFDLVEAVTYGYEDLAPGPPLDFARDSLDLFTVGLRLSDGEEFTLFRFFGEGTFRNDGMLPDWCYWPEYTLDLSGDQEPRSRQLVDLLSAMLDVEVTPPR